MRNPKLQSETERRTSILRRRYQQRNYQQQGRGSLRNAVELPSEMERRTSEISMTEPIICVLVASSIRLIRHISISCNRENHNRAKCKGHANVAFSAFAIFEGQSALVKVTRADHCHFSARLLVLSRKFAIEHSVPAKGR